jgi:hypothetical protein
MIRTETFIEEPDLVLYVHPKPTLANWNTTTGPTILCTQAAAPNKGLYTVVYDDLVATEWGIFVGASQPPNWSAAIGYIGSSDPSATQNLLITVDPRPLCRVSTENLEGTEIIIHNEEVRTVLLMLTSGTFGDVPVKFTIEDSDGNELVLIENLQSPTNALIVTIPSIDYPQGCCRPSWSVRRMSGNTVVTSGTILVKYAP